MRKLKFFLAVILILAAVIAVFVLVIKSKSKREKNMIYGASFNSEYAAYLGLNPRDAFNKILGEWNFKRIRLSAQWDLIEKNKGEYDWSELDWMMNEAAKKNAKVILAVGHRTPRWPECHYPKWIDPLTHASHGPELLRFVELTVNRYKNHPALEVW
ncbi:MAG: beta-galactosidase, partial [Patescibacteria group bacterium]